jgi:hypothetical protein
MLYVHNVVLFNSDEWFNYVFCRKIDGIWNHHDNHHMPVSKKPKIMFLVICGIWAYNEYDDSHKVTGV